ncbi:Zn-dependent hydrolase [Microvirga massiliensis]|uniref:Zn-dependent hydrolase n=1 Tax=Microvirga massiliensis TaxID=1033741 RepID=UPI00062BB516|nr:Zn-dependent hydrolase [Microvirga massiliensis]
MIDLAINAERLLARIREFGQIGRDRDGKLVRLAGSDADKAGRDTLVAWLREAGLEAAVDRVGNIFGIWKNADNAGEAPVLLGSHIDTVIDAGIYDGCYGVLSGLEVIETLKAAGFASARPIAVAAFTNEEGVRYAPDMMGSLVYAGGLTVEDALAAVGTDGTVLGAELERIGYAGSEEPGFLTPHAYLELHIEQGPVLEREGVSVGVVENLQGISWQRITVEGVANHAGTTPMSMRKDAGHAAARVITFLRDRARNANTPTVATVGCMSFEPNGINVIPSRATFTVDLRNPDEQRLQAEEAALAGYLRELAAAEDVTISVERLVRTEPVTFDGTIVALIEDAARERGLAAKRMTSGAGHDAQMIARIAPSAMIFVPSIGGISHNPRERTHNADLIAGANILLDVVTRLAANTTCKVPSSGIQRGRA